MQSRILADILYQQTVPAEDEMTIIKANQQKALELRKTVLSLIHEAGSGHCGGSLSCMEILTVLFNEVLRFRANDPAWPDRDRFLLSKGHAAPALYCVLASLGYFDLKEVGPLRKFGSSLQGHPCKVKLQGIEVPSGPLGMGISVGVGMALAAKLQRRDFKVVVLCGDGEMQEGQNWEALMSVGKWNLDNLTIIIDRNHVQLDGTEYEIMPMGDLAEKIAPFGLHTMKCNGHDIGELLDVFQARREIKKPVAIIAETVKGKGISFMEGQSAWHGKPLNKEDYALAMSELNEVAI
jgi:transketolase